MTWTPTDEQVEKAAEALREVLGFGDTPLASLTPDARNGYMRQMHAVLVAVGPMIAAQVLRHAAADILTNPPIDRYGRVMTGARAAAKQVQASADTIEKEAAGR